MGELLDIRIKQLNSFLRGILDIQYTRNPLAQEAILIFNDIMRDQYQDPFLVENARVKKQVIVKKNIDMNYVQQLTDELLEDTTSIPWMISFTTTGLPRNPSMDDAVLINGMKYTISLVKPVNRSIDYTINALIYPERSEPDALAIHKISYFIGSVEITDLSQVPNDGILILDIIYGGNPEFMSFDSINWFKFTSRVPIKHVSGDNYVYENINFNIKTNKLFVKNNIDLVHHII